MPTESATTTAALRRDVAGMVTAGVFIIMAVVALWDTTTMTDADSYVFPRTIAIAMIVFCLLLIGSNLIRPGPSNGDDDDNGYAPSTGASTPRRVGLVAAMLAGAALMPWLGFLPSGLLVFIAIMGLAMYDPWTPYRKVVYPLTGAAVVTGFYFLFAKVLLVPLPTGTVFQ